jgi:hypothetical protein
MERSAVHELGVIHHLTVSDIVVALGAGLSVAASDFGRFDGTSGLGGVVSLGAFLTVKFLCRLLAASLQQWAG